MKYISILPIQPMHPDGNTLDEGHHTIRSQNFQKSVTADCQVTSLPSNFKVTTGCLWITLKVDKVLMQITFK